MAFQAFVHGDGYAPEDWAVLDDAIRGAAFDASNARLNELHAVIEAELPGLFGADGENPAWSDNAGPEPSPAFLEMAAAEREADMAGRREQAMVDAICPERAADDAMAIAMWRSRAREAEAGRR